MAMFFFAIVSLHVLAAVMWIGGMVFLSLVLAPLLRSANVTSERVTLFRSTAKRFRIVAWLSIVALLTTGPALLHARHLLLTVPTDWPAVVRIKIGLVGLLLLLTIAHDLYLGPRAGQFNAIPESARTRVDWMLVMTSRWLPRFSLLIAVAVVVAAAVLARS
jgi:copper resistance protein D